jgi:glycosyltransferase involved in cell wall biosynthesis
LPRLIERLEILPDTPRVSVCIPVYNAGHYLRLAISSVLAQRFTDFELIIVDDCSTEKTESVLAEFEDPRLRFYRNAQNLGLVGNWNHCLELTRGDYIAIFHQDDVMSPDHLMRQVAMLDKNSSIGFVYTNLKRIDALGQEIGGHWLPNLSQPEVDVVLPGEAIFEVVATYGNIIPCPSVVVRRECYERVGLFDASLPFATDLEMWMRIAAHYDVGYLADPLIAQRVHPEQETAKFANTGRDYLDVLQALNLIFSSRLPETHRRHARQTYRALASQSIGMAKWKIRQGQIANGLRYLSVAGKALVSAVHNAKKLSRNELHGSSGRQD